MVAEWETEKAVTAETFSLVVNSTNYSVTLSSPLLGLFLEKENLKDSTPPIHVELTNEEVVRNCNAANGDNKAGKELRKMEKILVNYDHESSASSTKGISSAVNVLSNYSDNDSVPTYKWILLVFSGVLVVCLAANLGLFLFSSLEWDNSSPNRNPISDAINLYDTLLINL